MSIQVKDFLLDLFYPKHCPWCERVLGFVKVCTCEADVMAQQLEAKPLVRFRMAHIEEWWACFEYRPPVSVACHRLKYEGVQSLASPIGEVMSCFAKQAGFLQKIDVVVPVPMAPLAKKERGFNQSELLAGELCKKSGLLLQTDWLQKTRETTKQRTLSRKDRQSNVKDAFCVSPQANFGGKHVLLIDDVLTTGSTLSECAAVVKAAGAASCFAFTFLVVQDDYTGLDV